MLVDLLSYFLEYVIIFVWFGTMVEKRIVGLNNVVDYYSQTGDVFVEESLSSSLSSSPITQTEAEVVGDKEREVANNLISQLETWMKEYYCHMCKNTVNLQLPLLSELKGSTCFKHVASESIKKKGKRYPKAVEEYIHSWYLKKHVNGVGHFLDMFKLYDVTCCGCNEMTGNYTVMNSHISIKEKIIKCDNCYELSQTSGSQFMMVPDYVQHRLGKGMSVDQKNMLRLMKALIYTQQNGGANSAVHRCITKKPSEHKYSAHVVLSNLICEKKGCACSDLMYFLASFLSIRDGNGVIYSNAFRPTRLEVIESELVYFEYVLFDPSYVALEPVNTLKNVALDDPVVTPQGIKRTLSPPPPPKKKFLKKEHQKEKQQEQQLSSYQNATSMDMSLLHFIMTTNTGTSRSRKNNGNGSKAQHQLGTRKPTSNHLLLSSTNIQSEPYPMIRKKYTSKEPLDIYAEDGRKIATKCRFLVTSNGLGEQFVYASQCMFYIPVPVLRTAFNNFIMTTPLNPYHDNFSNKPHTCASSDETVLTDIMQTMQKIREENIQDAVKTGKVRTSNVLIDGARFTNPEFVNRLCSVGTIHKLCLKAIKTTNAKRDNVEYADG